MKVVVTGGAGFIGSHLVRELLNRGEEVHVIDNFAGGVRTDRFHEGAVYHKLDVRNPACKKIFEGATHVYHTAALPRVQFSIDNPYDTHEANVTGTLCVLLAAKDAGVKKVVYSASSSAYGDPIKLPQNEDMPARPKSPYGLQKYMGEMQCRVFSEVYGLPTVCLRYFNVYGPAADPNGPYAQVIPKFIEAVAQGKPMIIFGDGTQTRDIVHVRDVVAANIAAAHSEKVGKGESINIGTGRNISINTIAELIGGPKEHIDPRFEPHDTLADISKAKEFLDWEPKISLEEGIAELKKMSNLL